MPAILLPIASRQPRATGIAVRMLMAAAAAAAAVWLGLSYVWGDQHVRAIGMVLSPEGRSPAGNAEARNARRLHPDAGPKLTEAAALVQAERNTEAERLLLDSLDAEPENAEAWLALSRTTRGPALMRKAARRFRELRPR